MIDGFQILIYFNLELFNDAQLHIYTQMERDFLSGFLKSQDGENYLKMLADRELYKLKQL